MDNHPENNNEIIKHESLIEQEEQQKYKQTYIAHGLFIGMALGTGWGMIIFGSRGVGMGLLTMAGLVIGTAVGMRIPKPPKKKSQK